MPRMWNGKQRWVIRDMKVKTMKTNLYFKEGCYD